MEFALQPGHDFSCAKKNNNNCGTGLVEPADYERTQWQIQSVCVCVGGGGGEGGRGGGEEWIQGGAGAPTPQNLNIRQNWVLST